MPLPPRLRNRALPPQLLIQRLPQRVPPRALLRAPRPRVPHPRAHPRAPLPQALLKASPPAPRAPPLPHLSLQVPLRYRAPLLGQDHLLHIPRSLPHRPHVSPVTHAILQSSARPPQYMPRNTRLSIFLPYSRRLQQLRTLMLPHLVTSQTFRRFLPRLLTEVALSAPMVPMATRKPCWYICMNSR